MSKYVSLVNDLIKQTKKDNIEWSVCDSNKYEDEIFQPLMVYRVIEGVYERNDASFTVLIVEKKHSKPELDYYEQHTIEVLFLKGRKLITTITQDIVHRDKLIDLLQEVENNTTDLNELFDGLDS
ncbi:MAG: hypothetical protein WDA20_02095 [Desulfuromonadales bacterium]